MKKTLLITASCLTVATTLSFHFLSQRESLGEFQLEETKEEAKKIDKAQRAYEAAEYIASRRKDEYGNYKESYYRNAIAQANQLSKESNRSGALNLQWEELGPDNVGGRTRAILIDKRDPSNNTIYAGGVSGGMWKSTDQGATWQRMSSWNEWLAISCIYQGPDNTIYIGTGEGLAQPFGTSLNSGSYGNGIYRLDANDNPVRITPDAYSGSTLNTNSPWSIVNRIAVNPDPSKAGHILAGTGGGLWETLDGGSNWSQVTLPGISNGQEVADIKWSKDGINIFAAVGGTNDLVRSRNGGASWDRITNVTNPGFPATQGRIELAIAPSNSNVVYASIATSPGCTFATFRTADGGDTWTNIGSKGPLFDPMGPNCQGWYDNVIAVSPADPNKVYLGGVDFYTWSDQSGWKLADAGLGSSEVNPNYIHPDKHAITIADNDPNLMFVGHDGGISRSRTALSKFPFPDYQVVNRGYNVTQFYSIAASLGGEVMGGTQDNGTPFINLKGNTRMASKMVIGGDGVYTDMSHIDTRILFGGVYFGAFRRSGNFGSSFDGFYDIKIDPQGHGEPSRCGGQQGQNAPFITPGYLGETKSAANGLITVPFVANRDYSAGEVVSLVSKTGKAPFTYTLTSNLTNGDTLKVSDPYRSRFFVTSNCGVFVTPDALDLANIPRWFRLAPNIQGTVVSYSLSKNGDRLYIGTNGGRVYRFDNFNARLDTLTYPVGNTVALVYPNTGTYSNFLVANGRSLEGISVDPNDPDHVAVAVAGYSATNQPHVYESFDGGTTWTPLTNGLPNMPAYDIVVHDANAIVLGTELGLWSWDGSTWHEENNGVQRVPVFRLREYDLYTEGCRVIYAGTHGRGLWRTTYFAEQNGCKTVAGMNEAANVAEITNLSIYPNPVNANSKVALTLEKPADVALRIFDITGKLYKEVMVRNTVAGNNLFDLNASGLPAGKYVLSATVGGVRTQSKLFTVAAQ